MTLARNSETSVQCGEVCRQTCRECMTGTSTRHARRSHRRTSKYCSNRHRKLLPLRPT
ncbi:hypothetical protein JYU34_013321 [Plutella xylostella]|uniref:C2H2-type domain-containing protein n=1 Tax=Plutella xylostella TaxID=51655 RepID=A0ABQ7Q9I9_PLUXY|nr:hypothetical protein JYU34_013321 [Plutella xylostella]